jgi:hypothetical protein
LEKVVKENCAFCLHTPTPNPNVLGSSFGRKDYSKGAIINTKIDVNLCLVQTSTQAKAPTTQLEKFRAESALIK